MIKRFARYGLLLTSKSTFITDSQYRSCARVTCAAPTCKQSLRQLQQGILLKVIKSAITLKHFSEEDEPFSES